VGAAHTSWSSIFINKDGANTVCAVVAKELPTFSFIWLQKMILLSFCYYLLLFIDIATLNS
jgi:hypothetical protein